MGIPEERKIQGEKVSITPQEKKLLDYFRNHLQYGEVIVIVKRGLPVFIRQVIKEVKLDS